MATKKRTVITEETHEVWIIRTDDEVFESHVDEEPSSAEVDPALALEPMDDHEE